MMGAISHFTEKLATDLEGVFSYFTKDVPLRRVARPAEIFSIFVYLADAEASYMDRLPSSSSTEAPRLWTYQARPLVALSVGRF